MESSKAPSVRTVALSCQEAPNYVISFFFFFFFSFLFFFFCPCGATFFCCCGCSSSVCCSLPLFFFFFFRLFLVFNNTLWEAHLLCPAFHLCALRSSSSDSAKIQITNNGLKIINKRFSRNEKVRGGTKEEVN